MSKENFRESLEFHSNNTKSIINNSIDGILSCFEKMSDVDIMMHMKDMSDLARAQLELRALTSGRNDLANKINSAMKNIKTQQIEDLREAIANGKKEEFLSKLSWVEKSNLSVIIQSRNDILIGIDEDFSKASKEDQALLETLEESINQDLLAEAQKEGFDNLEDWRKNNAKKAQQVNRGFDFDDMTF